MGGRRRSARCRRPAGNTRLTIDFCRAAMTLAQGNRGYTVANGSVERSDGPAPIRYAKEPTMGNWKKAGLIGLGAVLGVLLSLNFSAVAQRDARMPIP